MPFRLRKIHQRGGGGALVWVIPDTVREEEVRRLDGGQLRQEGGGHRDGDVAGGRHAALVVHVPVSARRGGLKRCTDVCRQQLAEGTLCFGGFFAAPVAAVTLLHLNTWSLIMGYSPVMTLWT